MKLRSSELLIEYMNHRQGMTCVELGRAAGVSKQFISRLRRKHDDTCKPETAERIERALGVPAGALFEARMSISSVRSDNQQKAAA